MTAGLNAGCIFCIVKDSVDDHRIEAAQVTLSFLQGGDTNTPARIFDINGTNGHMRDDTDFTGCCLVEFQWDPIQIAGVLQNGMEATYHLAAVTGIRPTDFFGNPIDKGYLETLVEDKALVVVSLSQLTVEDLLKNINNQALVKMIKKYGAEIIEQVNKHPFTLFAKLSPERFQLFGVTEILMSPQTTA